jgi:hypothetical protein
MGGSRAHDDRGPAADGYTQASFHFIRSRAAFPALKLVAYCLTSRQYYNTRNRPVYDLVVAHAVCWPLIAACSIKVKNPGANFKPEYVVPQLILQWITDETRIDQDFTLL